MQARCAPRPWRLALAAVIACLQSIAAPVGAAQPQACGAELAFSVAEVAGSPYKRFDGRICVRATPAEIVELFHLEQPYTEWLYRCEQAKTLTDLGAGHRILYFRYDGPFFLPDQEILAEAIMQRSADGESIRIRLTSVADEDSRLLGAQIPRHRGSVRARSLDAEWRVTRLSSRRLEIRYRAQLVPGGLAPTRAANALTRISVRKSLLNLKQFVESGRADLRGSDLFDGLPVFADGLDAEVRVDNLEVLLPDAGGGRLFAGHGGAGSGDR